MVVYYVWEVDDNSSVKLFRFKYTDFFYQRLALILSFLYQPGLSGLSTSTARSCTVSSIVSDVRRGDIGQGDINTNSRADIEAGINTNVGSRRHC
jgi:hypothetical protein